MRPPKRRGKRRRSKDKGPLRQNLEFAAVLSALFLVRRMAGWMQRGLAALLGETIFWCVPRRRRTALANLRVAFPEMAEDARRRIARASCRSFILTGLEGVKHLHGFAPSRARERVHELGAGIEAVFERARKHHEEAGGCIFVVPHLGNWELLTHAATLAGIPLTITVRPLDNKRLEKYLFEMRSTSGHQILSKRNALFHLREALRRGRSIGILADQHAGAQGVEVPFFGRPASTTTAPAVLALHFGRPIVLVTSLRRSGSHPHEAFLSGPIRPDPEADSRAEVERITAAVNRETEALVRMAPGQYLWMHDRWKLVKGWAGKAGR